MKLVPFLRKSDATVQPWQWPSCRNTKTTSFRHPPDDVIFNNNKKKMSGAPEFEFEFESSSPEFEFEFELSSSPVIRGLRSERLFYEPGETTSSSIMEEKSINLSYKEVSMDSKDPYADFRSSMEEMVEAHGFNDWTALEELLSCYLRVNDKTNHAYIIGAFIDLLLIAQSSSSSASSSFTISHSSSPLSLPCSSHPLDHVLS